MFHPNYCAYGHQSWFFCVYLCAFYLFLFHLLWNRPIRNRQHHRSCCRFYEVNLCCNHQTTDRLNLFQVTIIFHKQLIWTDCQKKTSWVWSSSFERLKHSEHRFEKSKNHEQVILFFVAFKLHFNSWNRSKSFRLDGTVEKLHDFSSKNGYKWWIGECFVLQLCFFFVDSFVKY